MNQHRIVGSTTGMAIMVVVAGVGIAQAGGTAVLPIAMGLPGVLAMVGVFGVPVAGVIGWLAGPAVVRGDPVRARWLALGIAALGVVVGSGFVSTVTVVGQVIDGTSSAAGAPGAVLVLSVLGLLFVGPQAIVVAAPICWVWVALVRLLASRHLRTVQPADSVGP